MASAWEDLSELKRETDNLSDQGENGNNNTDISDLVSNGLELLLEKSWLRWFLGLLSDDSSNGVWSNSHNDSLSESRTKE